MKRYLALPLAAFLALATPSCTQLGIAQTGASAATNLSTITPSQVKTLAEADLAADLLVRGGRIIVDTGKLDAASLNELQALRGGVRTALDALHVQQAAGHSLVFGSFNAAVDAYKAYAALKGQTH